MEASHAGQSIAAERKTKNDQTNQRHPGFTLIELILAIGIFVIMIAALLPFGGTFRQTQTLESLKEDTVQVLRRAQFKAMTGERDSAWGVKFLPDKYVLYAGSNYVSRNAAYDEIHPIEAAFSFSGLDDVSFLKQSGAPSAGGSVTITHANGGGTRVIQVSGAGGIFP